MTARNVQQEAKKKGLPWAISKGFDTFLPMSQYIAKEKVPDPHNIGLYLTVNGQTRQEDSTNLMIFKIPTLLSSISSCMTLEPGDIILSGTPKGVGRVVVGDVMTAGIRVEGRELEEAKIEAHVAEKGGRYEYRET